MDNLLWTEPLKRVCPLMLRLCYLVLSVALAIAAICCMLSPVLDNMV